MSRPGWGRRSRKPRFVEARLDGWSSNDSPLEHYLLLRALIRSHAGPEHDEAFIERCARNAWPEHLTACASCSRIEAAGRATA